jgi:replicative DNA helicase
MNIQQPTQQWVPISLDAEQAVLGSLLLNNDLFARISAILDPGHFSEPVHSQIFEIITALTNAGKPAGVLTVPSFMPRLIEGTRTSAKVYLARLAAEAIPANIAIDYAKHVREMADRRRIAEIAVQMAPDAATEAAHLAAEAIEALDTIVTSSVSGTLPAASMAEVMIRSVDKIAAAYANDSKIIGIPTGLKDLDAKTSGLHRGNLILLAGRPGMGKSAVILNWMRQAGKRGFRSLFFSKEMTAEELGERMISDYMFDIPRIAKVSYNNLRNGNFHEQMFDYVREAAEQCGPLPIDVEEQPGLTMSQIATRARRYKRKHGKLDILAIDHLGLIRASGRYQGNRVNEIMEITGAAKALAKELDCALIMLSQLSRDVEKREDKRPILSDLRDSGAIEQDADSVIFLYRPSYYLQQSEPAHGTEEHMEWERKSADAYNKLFAIIAKQRMGPTGPVDLFCDIACNAIRDLGIGEAL